MYGQESEIYMNDEKGVMDVTVLVRFFKKRASESPSFFYLFIIIFFYVSNNTYTQPKDK